MIFVSVQAIKSDERGSATGNGWHDTNSISDAIETEMQKFDGMWQMLGHGAAVTYVVTVATEASPRRTGLQGWPLPVEAT